MKVYITILVIDDPHSIQCQPLQMLHHHHHHHLFQNIKK